MTELPVRDGEAFDVIVVGGGHNGLVAANYLARAGKTVLVIERREIYRRRLRDGGVLSGCPIFILQLRPIRSPAKSGGRSQAAPGPLSVWMLHAPDPQGFALFDDGSHILLWQDIDKTLKQLEKIEPDDARGLLQFGSRLRRFGDLTADWILNSPPTRSAMLKRFEDAGEQELLNEFLFGSTRDLLTRYFKSAQIRGFYTFFGIVSIWGGPSTPGTGYLFGYHFLRRVRRCVRPLGFPSWRHGRDHGGIGKGCARAWRSHSRRGRPLPRSPVQVGVPKSSS